MLEVENLDAALAAELPPQPPPWYHPNLAREGAEQILSQCPPGSFLVRTSSTPDCLVLSQSVHTSGSDSKGVRHYRLTFYTNLVCITDGPLFAGLDALVHHYKNSSDGLFLPLTQHIPFEEKMEKEAALEAGVRLVLHHPARLLHKASANGQSELVRRIICNKHFLRASVDWRNQEADSALHIACRSGHPDIVRMLANVGADLNLRCGTNDTPTHLACQHNHITCLQLLVSQGADLQSRNHLTGLLPLHLAAKFGNLRCVEMLTTNKVAPLPRNFECRTPLDFAKEYNFPGIVKLLENYVFPDATYSKEDFLHGKLSRQEAYRYMENYNLKDGMFLVRHSSNCASGVVLTFFYDEGFHNYEIEVTSNSFFFIDDSPLFPTLETLIDYFTRQRDGLKCALLHPIAPRSSPRGVSSPTNKQRDDKIIPPNNMISNDNVFARQIDDEIKIIDVTELEFGRFLGGGEFGEVVEAKWCRRYKLPINVAVKKMLNENSEGEPSYIAELRVLAKLNHPNIAQLKAVCFGPPVMLVSELIEMGGLLQYLSKTKPANIELKCLYLWSAQIAGGMMYLEANKVIHRDLAARNILLASLFHAKITDFGLSRICPYNQDYYLASSGGKWPVKWFAPECINEWTFNSASDVWSYGITLWEMFSFGKEPYHGMSWAEVYEMLERGERMSPPNDCPVGIAQLMQNCWNVDPKQRPTFASIHEMFECEKEYSCIQSLPEYVSCRNACCLEISSP